MANDKLQRCAAWAGIVALLLVMLGYVIGIHADMRLLKYQVQGLQQSNAQLINYLYMPRWAAPVDSTLAPEVEQ